MFLGHPSCLLALVLATTAAQKAPMPSPKASTDLICHTSIPAECYPALFSPTEDFQVIHDDQSIPPGLHVRMNLATGLKEARLNIPEEGGEDDAAAVVIDNTPSHEETDQRSLSQEQMEPLIVQSNRAKYDAFLRHHSSSVDHKAGPSDGGELAATVSRVVAASSSQDHGAIMEDLEHLTDLAHDVEWGLAIAQDAQFSALLLRLIVEGSDSGDWSAPSAAAVLLGTALQNNDGALRALISHSRHPTSAIQAIFLALGSISLKTQQGDARPNDMAYASRLIFLLSQICQDRDQLGAFVASDGLNIVGRLLETSVDPAAEQAKTKLKVKVANFVIDFASVVAQYQLGRASLVQMCDVFRTGVPARYLTSSAEHRSSVAAFEKLQGILGDQCS